MVFQQVSEDVRVSSPPKAELPRSREAEERIIAAILYEPDLIEGINLEPDHFYHEENRLIFDVQTDIYVEGIPPELNTLVNRLREKGWLEKVGGATRIGELVGSVSTTANIVHWCHLVERCALQRRIIRFGLDMAARAYSQEPHQLLSKEQETLAKLNGTSIGGGDRRLLVASNTANALLAGDYSRPGDLVGKGIITMASYNLLYGRPGLGKTWIALQLAIAIASGTDFFGIPCEQARVGILEMELHTFYVRERLQALAKFYRDKIDVDKALKNIEIISRPEFKGTVDITNTATLYGLVSWMRERELSFMIPDAFSRIHYASEIDQQQMGNVLRSLEIIRDETECALMPIHHEPKGSGDDRKISDLDAARGHSRMTADAMTCIRLRKFRGKLCLRFTKTNISEDVEDIFLERTDTGPLRMIDYKLKDPAEQRAMTDATFYEVWEAAGATGISLAGLVEKTGFDNKTIKRKLEDANQPHEKRGQIFVHPKFMPKQDELYPD
jgi:hypothetical protein